MTDVSFPTPEQKRIVDALMVENSKMSAALKTKDYRAIEVAAANANALMDQLDKTERVANG